MHFEGVLNVPSTVHVAAEVIAVVEEQATAYTIKVIREEVEVAVRKLKNGKALGSDKIVAELVKNGGQVMVDWLWELLRKVWRQRRSASRVEECHPDPTPQEAKREGL